MSFQTSALQEQQKQIRARIQDGKEELFDPLSAQLISLVATEADDSAEDEETKTQRRERYAQFGRPTKDYSWAYFPHSDQWVAFTRQSTDSILKVNTVTQARLNRQKRTARFAACDLPTWIIRVP